MTQAVKSPGATLLSSWYRDGHVTLKTRPDTVPLHRAVYEQQTERVCLPFGSLVCSMHAGSRQWPSFPMCREILRWYQWTVRNAAKRGREQIWWLNSRPRTQPWLKNRYSSQWSSFCTLFWTVERGFEGALETCKDWVGQLYEPMKMNRSFVEASVSGEGIQCGGMSHEQESSYLRSLIWGAGKATPPSPHWSGTRKSHHWNPLFGWRQTSSKYILLNTPY